MVKKQEIIPPITPVAPAKPKNTLYVVLTVLAVIFVIAFILMSWFIGTYNTFVTAKTDVDTQWSNVKTEYQRRADLIINVAEVAKGYANFEQDTLIAVTQARGSNFQGSNDKAAEMENLKGLDSAISRLLAVFEQYPTLKAVEQYNKLSDELKNTENRVNIARTDYNNLVRSYNILIKKFPANMLANMYGFTAEAFFENEPGTTSAPKLNMTR
jgi:LemA protein